MVKIAPSILAASFENLEQEIKSVVDAGADLIHVDIMDGKFVANETKGLEMYQKAKKATNLPIDTHLMVDNPKEWIDEIFSKYMLLHNIPDIAKLHDTHQHSSDIISFHIEAVTTNTAHQLIDRLHQYGMKASIAIKPNTPIKDLLPFFSSLDMVLVMTVEPGFGGQVMIEDCLKKVKELKRLEPKLDIEVDGGINLKNIKEVKATGANVIVAGTSIFKSEDRKHVIEEMKYFT
ncbi:MAG: ribulose-phosphate 3-epimerase [Clostridia bacterium]|nr:ribulose-phosphate 3-epimerase [Clostridia bacterium]